MDDNSGSDDEFSDATDHTMAPIKLECQVPDCTGGTGGTRWSCEEEPTVAVALLQGWKKSASSEHCSEPRLAEKSLGDTFEAPCYFLFYFFNFFT